MKLKAKRGIIYRISLTGDLGSGKSTVCSLLAEAIGAEVVSIGSMQRKLAAEMGMTTLEFSHYMEGHPEIDNEFDDRLKSYDGVVEGNYIFDSRLAWNFVPSAFSVYLTVDPHEGAKRVFLATRSGETYLDEKDAFVRLGERRKSEMLRYGSAYGVDLSDMTNYDLIIDSTSASPSEIAHLILEEYSKKLKGKVGKTLYLSPYRIYPLKDTTPLGEPVVVVRADGYYFLTVGLASVARKAYCCENLVPVTAEALSVPAAATYVAKHYDKKRIKEWEAHIGFSYPAYPDKHPVPAEDNTCLHR